MTDRSTVLGAMWHGVMPATTTPFCDDGSIDLDRVRQLASALRQALQEAGLAPLAMAEENTSHLVAVPLAGRDPATVLATLKAQGILCSSRDGHLRISPHFYNDESDVEKVVAGLRRAL